MVWKETCAMEERVRFVMAAVDDRPHQLRAVSLLPIFKRERDRDGSVFEDPAQRRHREDQAPIHQTANPAVRERRYQAGVSATFRPSMNNRPPPTES